MLQPAAMANDGYIGRIKCKAWFESWWKAMLGLSLAPKSKTADALENERKKIESNKSYSCARLPLFFLSLLPKRQTTVAPFFIFQLGSKRLRATLSFLHPLCINLWHPSCSLITVVYPPTSANQEGFHPQVFVLHTARASCRNPTTYAYPSQSHYWSASLIIHTYIIYIQRCINLVIPNKIISTTNPDRLQSTIK